MFARAANGCFKHALRFECVFEVRQRHNTRAAAENSGDIRGLAHETMLVTDHMRRWPIVSAVGVAGIGAHDATPTA